MMTEHEITELIAQGIVHATADVVAEFKRASEKHGVWRTPANPSMADLTRLPILGEEFGEVCTAMTYDRGDTEDLEKELLQVATMALAWRVGIKVAKQIQAQAEGV
jgi:hypothetical protein